MADINVYGTVKTMAGDGKVAYASQVYDDTQQEFQSEINKKAENALQEITQQEFNELFTLQ